MDNFLAAHKLTLEQMRWLSLVREHLVKNLSMDEEDFDLTPLLQNRKAFGYNFGAPSSDPATSG